MTLAKTLNIATEGAHSVNSNGVITFTPKSTFKDKPTDIEYTIKSADGTITSNRARLSYEYQKIEDAHVFLIAGSTNAVGYTPNVLSQTYPDNVYQIAREISVTGNRDKSLASIEVRALDNNSMVTPKDTPSFAIEFINRYAADNAGVPIVLVPCAELLTSFASGSLGVGGANFNDALGRTNEALLANPTWSLKGILFHYGEDDARANNLDHKTQFQEAMAEFRNSLLGAESIPIIFGELASDWVQATGKSVYQTNIQWNTTRATNSYCASSTSPNALASTNEAFTDESLQWLGTRMYRGYRQIQYQESDALAHWIFGRDNIPYVTVNGALRLNDTSRISVLDSALFQSQSKPTGRTETGYSSGLRSFTFVATVTSAPSAATTVLQFYNEVAPLGGYIEISMRKTTSDATKAQAIVRVLRDNGSIANEFWLGDMRYNQSVFFIVSLTDATTINTLSFSRRYGAVKKTRTPSVSMQLSRGCGIGKGGRRIDTKVLIHELVVYDKSVTDEIDNKLDKAKQRFRDRFVNSRYNELGA